jgi:hypothetical protein
MSELADLSSNLPWKTPAPRIALVSPAQQFPARQIFWIEQMKHLAAQVSGIAAAAVLAVMLCPERVAAAPSAEVAKLCLRYGSILYPPKRAGAGKMSGERQTYIKTCMDKNGDVPAPTAPKT